MGYTGTGAQATVETSNASGILPSFRIASSLLTAFTPVLAFGGGSTGITFTSNNGYYVTAGDLVFYSVVFVLSSKGTDVGVASITNLPFPVATATNFFPPGAMSSSDITLAGQSYIVGIPQQSSTNLNFQASNTAGTPRANLTNVEFANTTAISVSGVYAR